MSHQLTLYKAKTPEQQSGGLHSSPESGCLLASGHTQISIKLSQARSNDVQMNMKMWICSDFILEEVAALMLQVQTFSSKASEDKGQGWSLCREAQQPSLSLGHRYTQGSVLFAFVFYPGPILFAVY